MHIYIQKQRIVENFQLVILLISWKRFKQDTSIVTRDGMWGLLFNYLLAVIFPKSSYLLNIMFIFDRYIHSLCAIPLLRYKLVLKSYSCSVLFYDYFINKRMGLYYLPPLVTTQRKTSSESVYDSFRNRNICSISLIWTTKIYRNIYHFPSDVITNFVKSTTELADICVDK